MMRGNMMPVVIGTSISSLTSNATCRSIRRSWQTARTCAFHPESVSTLARRTRAARRMAFKRHRARKNKAPAIHTPSRSLGRNAGIELAEDVVAVVLWAGPTSAEVGELWSAAVLLLTDAAG